MPPPLLPLSLIPYLRVTKLPSRMKGPELLSRLRRR